MQKALRLNNTGFMAMPSQHDPITKLGGNEEYLFGLSNYSEPWEAWTPAVFKDFFDFQTGRDGWVVAGAPWNDVRMNCSYNNGIQSCMGSCVNHEMGADALAFQRTVAARSTAAGLRSLMYGPLPPEVLRAAGLSSRARYFHAEISSESNASTKYSDSRITGKDGKHIFYACDAYYGLYLGNDTNAYGRELLRSIERGFREMNFTGLYHDEAGTTATAYTFHLCKPSRYRCHLGYILLKVATISYGVADRGQSDGAARPDDEACRRDARGHPAAPAPAQAEDPRGGVGARRCAVDEWPACHADFP